MICNWRLCGVEVGDQDQRFQDASIFLQIFQIRCERQIFAQATE
jgi:hypothetical protein